MKILRRTLPAGLLGLFAATVGVVFWQNSHVAVLWDLSYVLDSAARIAGGAVPYRDFPFAHAPLSFLIQALLLKLGGADYGHVQLYTALLGGLGTVLTTVLLLGALRERVAHPLALSLLLALPLTVLGLYCVFPFPSYDCDCAFAVLLALFLLQRLAIAANPATALLAGAALCLPLFFKQNIGLPFLAAGIFLLIVLLAGKALGWSKEENTPARSLLLVLAGAGVTLAAALLCLELSCGLEKYLHWTLGFAMQRRMAGSSTMLTVYREPALVWMLPAVAAGLLLLRFGPRGLWKQFAALMLLAAPLAYPIAALFLYDDGDERGDCLIALWPLLLVLAFFLVLRRLRRGFTLHDALPWLMLAAIHGTLLSQQLWGSTYSLWPLGILLVAELLTALHRWPGAGPRLSAGLGAVVSVSLLLCGGFYIVSEERLSYADLPEGPLQHATYPALGGMATPGPYLPEFEELLRYAAAKIPAQDGILLLPGEDPFYYATGRLPRFPVLLFDPATDPYTPAQVVEEVRRKDIRWLIVKTHLQIHEDPMPEKAATLAALLPCFTLADQLHGYAIYRRAEQPIATAN